MVNPQTKLFRQVHRSCLDEDGKPTSQAFKPTKKDNGLLSVYDGDKIEAEDAWNHYTKILGFSSVGVIAVTVGECRSLGLQVRPDPAPFPEHAVIDFSDFSRSSASKKASNLVDFAAKHDWQHRPHFGGGEGLTVAISLR